MFFDFREEATPAAFSVDVCIIGAGAAGIAMALELSRSSLSVCLVESGGFDLDGEVQALYEGTSDGLDWGSAMSANRMRFFGGTTAVWGGGCAPLDDIDFEPRDWVAHSGWPIGPAELKPYQERARAVVGIPKLTFGDQGLIGRQPHKALAFDPARLGNAFWMDSRKPHFGTEYRAALQQAATVSVVLNANLMELESDSNARSVSRAMLRSLSGRTGHVTARSFVLACGGLENARLLLLSNAVRPQGLGNDHDLVGRFFMDHPTGALGTIVTDNPKRLCDAYNRHLTDRADPIFPEIVLSPALQRSEKILNGRLRPEDFEVSVPDGVKATRELRAQLRAGAFGHVAGNVWRGLKDIDDVVGSLYRLARGREPVLTHRTTFEGFFEQAPNPDSRVTLSDTKDALGQRRLSMHWQLTELDRRTYETACRVFAAELARLDLGIVQLDPWMRPGSTSFEGLAGAHHHMGTTRMSADPRSGVVDPQCRVHGIDNLYIAGSSVFPTGGWAFPTFNLIALALRLSDHLLERATR